jgi:thiol-disulfide isomerase/thioredoxin
MKLPRIPFSKSLLPLVSLTATSLLLASAPVQAQAPQTTAAAKAIKPLTIGESAPALQPAKWLKGAPIPRFEKGRIYVVEFWATWCGPCKANIPHLTEMAKKYKDKQVEIIGVDIWESSDPTIKTLPKVEAFVKSQGKQMDYHVAADGPDNRIANAWMKAAGEAGIPTAFVVGKDGKIAWIGNPALGLEAVLQQVIDDKFDVVSARSRRENQVGPLQAIQSALNAKDYPTALRLIDAEIAKKPEASRSYGMFRLVALAHTNLPSFKEQARELLTAAEGEISVYQMLCSIPASSKDLSPEAYQFGRTLVDEALLKKDREYMFFAMGAEIDASLGKREDAVRSQTAAVKAAETDTHCPPEFLEFLRKNLEKFKASSGK